MPNVRSLTVTNEGDTLHAEVRGSGPPLLMIAGGSGEGGGYATMAERLSDEFKVIIYDRRASGRSTMNSPDRFDIGQESRDAIAVLRAAGESSACFFGNSGGAVIALDLAASYPEAVIGLVPHEPPLVRVHPDSAKWQSFFRSVAGLHHRFGATIAYLKFTFGIGLAFDISIPTAVAAVRAARQAERASKVPHLDRRKVASHFLEREMVAFTDYAPDLKALQGMRERIAMAASRTSLARKRFFAETAPILSREIGCDMVIFPGHHGSFVDMPDEWSALLRSTLRRWMD